MLMKSKKAPKWLIPLAIIIIIVLTLIIVLVSKSRGTKQDDNLTNSEDLITDNNDELSPDDNQGESTSEVNASVNNNTEEDTADTATEDLAPKIEGYKALYYSDFGDSSPLSQINWGFIAPNARVAINKDDIAGNSTSKLLFSQVYQATGRNASKTLEAPITGDKVLLKFDWYPGEINDKGNNPEDNSGEVRILDGNDQIIFALKYTAQSPISYYIGNNDPEETAIKDPLKWYTVDLDFDLLDNTVAVKLTDSVTNESYQYLASLEGVNHDATIASIQLAGIHTDGNYITWTTYIDNLGFYHIPIPNNRVTSVDPLPYHRVYVGKTTTDISSLGLPTTVTVTMADNSKAEATVKEWIKIGEPWNPEVEGIYEFKGIVESGNGVDNGFNKYAFCYVYNRLTPPDTARQAEWLDRGAIALKSDEGIFISWRLLADEYPKDISFNIYKNGSKLNTSPLTITNFTDNQGKAGDSYTIETLDTGKSISKDDVIALGTDYISIPMQIPEGGTTDTGNYTYSVNDASVGDLDGDGQYEVIVKWYPSNAIDSSQNAKTGPTIFDAYKLDGTLMWRIDMGLNLTSGAHYHQFIVADLNGDGKSEFFIKTADATTVYGVTDGKYDSNKIIDVIGNPDDNGKWIYDSGHVYGGPEYITVFNGETGKVIDTIEYRFPVGRSGDWGDGNFNRSDRFLAALAYLDGKTPSVVFGRGYYARTTFVAYNLEGNKLKELWYFDSDEEGRGGGMGNHNLATADVDNDGFDEIIAGSLTLDHDGSILYVMDGEMGREMGSHGDALHVGAFDPDREGIHVYGVHEVPSVASLHYRDGATGESLMSYYAFKDAGRGVAANITSNPGYEFWGAGNDNVIEGGGIYNVQGKVIADSYRSAGLSVNFKLYWDGDLLHELLDNTSITKYNEKTGKAELVVDFPGVVSNNGTKATPSLQADILGDWREEVLLPTTDSRELRIFSTTIPTEYRLYTLMHDPVYRNGIAWQNTAYNQPPHISFYLGEDIRDQVLEGKLTAPKVNYTNR